MRRPIWFVLNGTTMCFPTGQWLNTPPGCVRTIWPRRRVMECCIRWPGLHNHSTSTQLRLVLDELDRRVKEKQPTSARHMWELLQDFGNRMPRVCKAVIKAKGVYFEESQISHILICLIFFLLTTWFDMCYFIVLISSPLFYNVENSQNKYIETLAWVGVLKLWTGDVHIYVPSCTHPLISTERRQYVAVS